MKLLFEFLPLILFFVAFKWQGIYIATGVAIAAAVLQFIWLKARGRPISTMQWISVGDSPLATVQVPISIAIIVQPPASTSSRFGHEAVSGSSVAIRKIETDFRTDSDKFEFLPGDLMGLNSSERGPRKIGRDPGFDWRDTRWNLEDSLIEASAAKDECRRSQRQSGNTISAPSKSIGKEPCRLLKTSQNSPQNTALRHSC